MKMKKVLAAVLATTMVFASALTVSATSGTTGSTGTSSSSAAEVVIANALEANASVSVGGTSVKTTIAGVYWANTVQGVAVRTDLATLRSNLGLTGSQTPRITVYDTDAKKSSKAMDSVNAAVAALGGTYVTSLNIDLYAVQSGKVVTLSNGTASLAVGLPKTADTSKTYSIVCVQPGGVTTVLDDLDTNPKTVTFAAQAGLGTYAIVAR
jgi:hypothetical protein